MSHSRFAARLRAPHNLARVLAVAAAVAACGALPLHAQEAAKAPAAKAPEAVKASAAKTSVVKAPAAKVAAKATAAALEFLEDDAEPQFTLNFNVKTAASGGALVVFDYGGDKNFYALEMAPKSARLLATINGKTRVLATVATNFPNGASLPVSIKRRGWAMEVVVAQQTILTAYEAARSSGKIGHRESGGWTISQPRMQPVDEIYFNDDFTRLPGENGEWKPASGTWKLTSTSEESAAALRTQRTAAERAGMSANPFAYRVEAKDTSAFVQSGRWFWDDYNAQVSVKPLARGTVGLAVYVQDAKNYLAFLWDSKEGSQARRLMRVKNGKETVLASTRGAFLPRQWYRLSVRTSPGFIETFIDGAKVFETPSNDFGQGGVALIARNIDVADFDDARVQSYSNYRQSFGNGIGSAWSGQGGAWNARAGTLASGGAKGSDATRFLVTGRGGWDGYTLSARTKIGGSGAAGLVVGYRDSKNYTVFRFAAPGSALPFRGRQQLMRYRDGKASIIFNDPLKLQTDKDGYADVAVRLQAGTVAAFNGDKLIAQMVDDTLSAGRPALWAQGAPTVMFRDVDVAFPTTPAPPRVPTKMADDALMVGWASTAGEWPPTNAESGIEYWNTGEFFGDASVEYPWKRSSYIGGKMELALRAARGKFGSGLMVRYEDIRDKSALRITLLRGDAVLKQADLEWEKLAPGSGTEAAKPILLRVQLEGRGILFFADGKPVMSYVVPDKDAASTRTDAKRDTNMAARSSGFRLSARDLKAVSANRDDYTFNDAPVDWYAPQGQWSVISRWPCYADWSFFGGSGLSPVLWSKREYSGDTVVEYYAHNQMDLPKEPGYSEPGNLNVTLFGDGKNPTSGYSFVIAGWDNTRTRLYKGTKMLAENTSDAARFIRPINTNPMYHNRWYYIRAEARHAVKDGKNGVMLKVSLDDVPLFEYFDASPLPAFESGGRVAFWTVDSVTMIARAKIESENLLTRSMPAGLPDSTTQPMLASTRAGDLAPRSEITDANRASAVIARDENGANDATWTITNPASGGSFLVQLGDEKTLAVSPTAKLEFDAAIPAGVDVDAYARAGEQLYEIDLGGKKYRDARVTPLGSATKKTTDAGWTHFSFPLGEALKKQGVAKVDALQLGALHGDEYRWAGFDGNLLCSSYKIRNVRLVN